MWDYNGDGIVNCEDDEAYWDDVYYEEHRDDYSGSLLGSHSSSVSNNSGKKSDSNSNSEDGIVGVAYVLLWAIRLVGAIFLGMFGIALLFAFPPLGAWTLYMAYVLLGGQGRLF